MMNWIEMKRVFILESEFPLVTGLSLALFKHGRFLVGREG